MREKMLLLCRQQNDIAAWHITDFGPAGPAAPLVSQTLPNKTMAERYPIMHKIWSNMVEVDVRTPYKTSGAFKTALRCMGFVINANTGFVITARSFMPSNLCILHIIFADLFEIPAKKLYDHALGFTVIQYDTSPVKGSIASVTFVPRMPKVQDMMTIYGPRTNGSGPCPKEAKVTRIGPLTDHYDFLKYYHPINVDVLHFEDDQSGGAGVLLDQNGDLQGLWLPFCLDNIKWVGIPISLLLPAFDALQKGILPPDCRMLDVELEAVHKNDVHVFGVPEGIAFS